MAGILGTASLAAARRGADAGPHRSGKGRPPKRLRRDAAYQPLPAGKLAAGLPAGAWKAVT